ncbi:MAG: AAA family ATPase [Caldilineaceae bacterium SB0665_bin_25]|nr:AAA family ATPase [Caldilineaceae bacterium SB0665_bin_25]
MQTVAHGDADFLRKGQIMDEIRLKDYRCFREKQAARLAPLTLLVGENSTGKTSFLAIVRALWDLAFSHKVPDFKEEPYDLGSFEEIAHYRGRRSGKTATFIAGFSATTPSTRRMTKKLVSQKFGAKFTKIGTTPYPIGRSFGSDDCRIEEYNEKNNAYTIKVTTARGSWEKRLEKNLEERSIIEERLMPPYILFEMAQASRESKEENLGLKPLDNSPAFGPEDYEALRRFPWYDLSKFKVRPFASAPVRSKPRRTYDPSRPTRDPEGDYVPMYLADVFTQSNSEWARLKEGLERFGKKAGLFDEIFIRRKGQRDNEPFQIHFRKLGSKLKGPSRNLIDIGYGVSQVLPVITELLRPDAAPLFLLQQPEIHLHPSAQAALGSLFCQIASRERQLIVETHSDHLLDRVRMDVRDGRSALKPEDVSILFFERNELDVHIHSLKIDGEGNVLNAPDSYRRFFMEETARSLGL